jgi:diaminohydroxyphosphoribosylaminopyrimidine deaminase / 5-amino-6-(5-phosphoribosylamino)uracil reductase
MARAIMRSRLGWGQVSPNPLVGAVVVREGECVGEGAHRRFGEAHAEVEALAAAGEQARGATLYVNLEPCTHYGKTPPCTDAIIRAGVSRVVVAVRDPDPDAGGGVERLRQAGITVDVGMLHAQGTELNAPFLHSFRSDRPWVTLKLAISLDGAIASESGTTTWLTGMPARQRVHYLRAGSDAIAVGVRTVVIDDPQLTVRDSDPPRVPLTRVIFSRRGQLPLDSKIARSTQEAPVIVVASSPDPDHTRALRERDVETLTATSLLDALRMLRARGIRSLLVEGGALLAASFLEADLVDRVILFQAPVVLGEGALPAFGTLSPTSTAHMRRWRPIDSEWIGQDQMLVFAPEGH